MSRDLPLRLRLRLWAWPFRKRVWHRLGRCYFARCGHARLDNGSAWYCRACQGAVASGIADALSGMETP